MALFGTSKEGRLSALGSRGELGNTRDSQIADPESEK